jgi:hypothetical protein
MEWISALLFAVLSPVIIISIMGMWLALFVRFGLFPLLAGQMTAYRKTLLAERLSQVIFVASSIGALVALFLLCNQWILEIVVTSKFLGWIYMFMFGPVPLVIVVEEWLALICYFGLHYLSDREGIQKLQQRRIGRYVVTGILLLSIFTSLVGFGWATYLGLTKQVDRYGEVGLFGVMVLGPSTGLLTMGLAAMLVISLGLDLGESNERRRRTAKSMTIALSITFVLLSLAGGFWSAFVYRALEKGW